MMAQIHVLDSETIDKIAAGEVVERPASVVKELVENAIDAKANAVTVEIKDGGIEFIRVTDNGSGMEKSQIRAAFLRHATSKIQSAEDLNRISSLGFRGEALSSITAVSKVELVTKTKESLTGSRMLLEGAVEKGFEEIGAPDGTTFLVRNLFYNTPVRRKFLKQPATEGGYVADLMEHLALSRPDVSFKFVQGNQTRFHTSGNGDLKEVIYRIFGRETAAELVPIQVKKDGISIEGYLGKPVLVRSNRNTEIYFINGRFIKSNVIARGIEEGYKEYLMQHKFPFCVLHITLDTQDVDVNVHPTKMDVRFRDGIAFARILSDSIHETLKHREMIPNADVGDGKEEQKARQKELKEVAKLHTPEPFEKNREVRYKVMEEEQYHATVPKQKDFTQNPVWNRVFADKEQVEPLIPSVTEHSVQEEPFFAEEMPAKEAPQKEEFKNKEPIEEVPAQEPSTLETTEQINLFENKLLSVDNRSRYRIIGQVFDTYWMVQFEEELFIIDQHAAHEKVKYERLMKQFHEKQVVSQRLMPPIVVSLSAQEESVWKEHAEVFSSLGFEVESFGGKEYALRSVPVDLYGCGEREMFLEVLDELSDNVAGKGIRVIEEKIASMSCKAAVKGNNRLSFLEAETLIDELLTLENPYNCPHGRPTIVRLSKTDMEKMFKRIV